MSKTYNYKPGNPEYDFWNDKNLYPDLKNDADYPAPDTSSHPASSTRTAQTPEDHKTSFSTVFLVTFLWLPLFAPFALFFTWEDSIVQIIFWGGITAIIITYALAFYNAYQDHKRQQK